MRILYGVQATGNGHLSRAKEMIPEFLKYGEVDVLVSGTEGSVNLPYDVKYVKHGLSFYFGKNGNVDYFESIKNCRPAKLIKDIMSCPLESYDVVISDFEPITAWASKIKGVKCIAMSHQAAFLSKKTPRPSKIDAMAERVLKHYAPTAEYLGIHFKEYDDNIFTPVIRRGIRALVPEEHNHYLVYLPAYSVEFLAIFLQQVDQNTPWRVFSKFAKEPYQVNNVEIQPISNEYWLESFRTARAVLIGGGFEGPAETLFLGKKLMLVPMVNQYEQRCNAIALEELGIPNVKTLDETAIFKIREWIHHSEAIKIDFPDNSTQLVQRAIDMGMA